MLFSFNFYSSLLLVIFCNGMLYSMLCFFKYLRQKDNSKIWLAIFAALCMLYITPWMLGFAGWYDDRRYRDLIFYIPFTHTFFIGPAFYFYIRSLLDPGFRFCRRHLVHLVPGMLYVLFSIVVAAADKIFFDEVYFLAEGSDLEFDTWYKIAGWLSMLAYFVFSANYFTSFKKVMANTVSFADSLLFRWIKNALTAFVAMLGLQVIYAVLFTISPGLESYKANWWFYFVFGIISIYVTINGFSTVSIAVHSYRIEDNAIVMLDVAIDEGLERIPLDDTKTDDTGNVPPEEWKAAVDEYMKGGAYRDPELTLPVTAKSLSSNSTTISRAINYYFGMNFNDYVNSIRVDSVKRAFDDNLQHRQTLLAIALDNGFNSKATFNRAFRKHTGFTPTEYLNRYKTDGQIGLKS